MKDLILVGKLRIMKRNLLVVLAVATSSLAFAQTTKTPLVEHFTQASCGPCASQNPQLQTTLTNFGEANYVRVAHQTSWPGFDPMNEAFPAGPEDRRNYYGVSGVPNVSLNGGPVDLPNTVVTSSSLQQAAQESTPYEIVVTQTWQNPSTVDVNIDITNVTGSAVSDADKVYITMTEDEIDYNGVAPGSNGETVFHNVMRQMYDDQGNPDATTGSALPTIAANSTHNISFTISSLPNYIADKEQIVFAVYIQNNATKEIFQAGKSTITQIPGIILVEAASASTAGTGYCDYSYTPGVEFTNNDSQTDVTSIVAEYSINGGAPVQETWTGTLTGGNSTTIMFPATSLASGTSVVSYEIVSVNGGQPWSSPQDITIPDEEYSKLSATGVAAPIVENLETGTLITGTGYTRDISTALFDAPGISMGSFAIYDGPAIQAGAIGGYGSSNRSILVQFYAIQNGVMNFTMDKVNLGTNSAISYDYAYCQYQSENDQMKVFVSTDCGATWNQEFSAAGSSLATLPAQTSQYVPQAASEWETNIVDLSAYDNMNDVVVRFEFTSAYGNNLWLDNINIGEANSVNEEEAVAFAIYPNPTTDVFTVKMDESSDVAIQVIDVQGKVVATQNVAGQSETVVDASALAPGIYTVLVSSENGVATKKVVVE